MTEIYNNALVIKGINSIEIQTKYTDHNFIVIIRGFVDNIKLEINKEIHSLSIQSFSLMLDTQLEKAGEQENSQLVLPDNVDLENYYYERINNCLYVIFNHLVPRNDFMYYY
ncbi:hypothetical protein [Plebeiibacterium sediminum]|uniref:Uncharacterized protein n=1 Tax=Plebeiibacterium sediminum TaxID=2992112 RepID=A0AAE3M7E8_9BACT|nr:hypothetical protein [Plebeiobacterium sediminum]MCW3788184.1 hypothetical protein [Plebeiobacterium sediminum]